MPSSRRVLVVDDELDTAETLATLLRSIGHDVKFAVRGAAALDIARRFLPQVVFLDLGLPDIDGCELARRLRAEPGLQSAMLLAFTGHDSERQRALAAGFDHFLLKPIDTAKIDALLG